MAVLSEAPSLSIQLPRSGGFKNSLRERLYQLYEASDILHRHRFAAAWPPLVRQIGPLFHRRRHIRSLPNSWRPSCAGNKSGIVLFLLLSRNNSVPSSIAGFSLGASCV